MKSIADLFAKWNSIASYAGGYLLISDNHPLAFHIGYEGEMQKSFVVLNTGKLEKINSSKAVAVSNIKLPDGSFALKFLLKYPSLDEIFIKLCWDLMETSANAENPLQKIIEQYEKWQKLLQKASDSILATNEQKGLIGELIFLKEMIDKEGIEKTLTAWTGPEGSDQDFNFEQFWVEIKTTSVSSTGLKISSLEQLDRNDKGYIVTYFMDPTPSHGPKSVSLDEAVDKVLNSLVSDGQRNKFECKLAKAGYQHKDAQKYHEQRYRLCRNEIYKITEDFPRLTKDKICSEIISVNYEIDLPSLDRFRCQEI